MCAPHTHDRFTSALGDRRGAGASDRFHPLGTGHVRGLLQQLLDCAAAHPQRLREATYPHEDRELRNASDAARAALDAYGHGGENDILQAADERIRALTPQRDARAILTRAACAIVSWDALMRLHADSAIYAMRLLVYHADERLSSDIELWLTGQPSPAINQEWVS